MVVVGPAAVCGPGAVDAELAVAAFGCIDDDVGLLRSRVIDTQRIWDELLGHATGGDPAVLTVVCPSYWPANRIDRVRKAGRSTADDVRLRERREVLREVAGRGECAVVEVGEDLVVVSVPGYPPVAIRRSRPALAQLVSRRLGPAVPVIIDVPTGIVGASDVAADISTVLGRKGFDVVCLSCRDLVRDTAAVSVRKPWKVRVMTAVAAAVAVVALLRAVSSGPTPTSLEAVPQPELTWLVEGEVAIEVPARWTVDRVLSDRGSARVQVFSPDEPSSVIHLTQTSISGATTLADNARVLRTAVAGVRTGVIVDFTEGTASGRDAITYREVRGDRVVQWAVLLDRGVRIAIGCQGPSIAAQCDAAIRSAHRLG